ncbi:MAG: hypothetical protein K6F09_06555 [Clostridiales bacterium]|nr:hypothetical protein [Clostridiales bacterium]
MAKIIKNIEVFFMLISALVTGIFGGYAKQEKDTIFIGHRGYSGLYQENTEEAFIKAGQKGFGGCETDVRVTKDGVLVLCHNNEMKYADGDEMEISSHTFAELSSKPIKNRKTRTELYICSFERYLEIMKEYNMFCFVELKGAYTPEQIDLLYRTMTTVYDLSAISVQGGGIDVMSLLHERHPDVPVMYCAGENDDKEIQQALDQGFDVDLHLLVSDIDWVAKFHEKGLRVAVWTANDPAKVSYALKCGVDFIESDFFCGVLKPYISLPGKIGK